MAGDFHSKTAWGEPTETSEMLTRCSIFTHCHLLRDNPELIDSITITNGSVVAGSSLAYLYNDRPSKPLIIEPTNPSTDTDIIIDINFTSAINFYGLGVMNCTFNGLSYAIKYNTSTGVDTVNFGDNRQHWLHSNNGYDMRYSFWAPRFYDPNRIRWFGESITNLRITIQPLPTKTWADHGTYVQIGEIVIVRGNHGVDPANRPYILADNTTPFARAALAGLERETIDLIQAQSETEPPLRYRLVDGALNYRAADRIISADTARGAPYRYWAGRRSQFEMDFIGRQIDLDFYRGIEAWARGSTRAFLYVPLLDWQNQQHIGYPSAAFYGSRAFWMRLKSPIQVKMKDRDLFEWSFDVLEDDMGLPKTLQHGA